MFKEMFNETSFKDGFGNMDWEKFYKEILRDIIDVKKNWAVMYKKGRLDILPKTAEDGDLESGPALAKKLLPKIQKAIKKYGFKAEIINIKMGPRSKRLNKSLEGGIKFTES